MIMEISVFICRTCQTKKKNELNKKPDRWIIGGTFMTFSVLFQFGSLKK